jgi:hypothetical protein
MPGLPHGSRVVIPEHEPVILLAVVRLQGRVVDGQPYVDRGEITQTHNGEARVRSRASRPDEESGGDQHTQTHAERSQCPSR